VAASWSFTENCHASPTGGALGSTNREEGGLTMRAHVAPCALVPRRRGRVHLRLREARPSSPSTPPGGRKTDDPQKESPGVPGLQGLSMKHLEEGALDAP
jgi:hypothetical protein